jgi:hypothetical protein
MNEWVWGNSAMILTAENWSTGRRTLYRVCVVWMNEYWAMVEWYWQGKTEVLGEEHYTACVVDEWMSMELWWNDTKRGKLKYWKRSLTLCQLSTTNSARNGPGLNAVKGLQQSALHMALKYSNAVYQMQFIAHRAHTFQLQIVLVNI